MKARVAARASKRILHLCMRGLSLQSRLDTDAVSFATLEYTSDARDWQYTPRRRTEGMAKKALPPAPPGYRWVFRPWRTDPKTGQRVYARTYGFKAWPIMIPE